MGNPVDDGEDALEQKKQASTDRKFPLRAREILESIIGGIIVAILLYLISQNPPIDGTEAARENLTESAALAESDIGNGFLYPAISQCKSSINLYNDPSNNINKSKLKREYSKILSVLGTAYFELSKCNDKKANLEGALWWFEEAYNHKNDAENLSNLGTIYFELSKLRDKKGNLEKSLQFLDKSLKSINDNESLAYADILIERGATFRHLSEVHNKRNYIMASLKDDEVALGIYMNSTRSNNGNRTDYHIGVIRNQLGACYRLLAEVEHQEDNLYKSIKNNTLAFEILEKNKMHLNDLSSTKYSRGNLYISLSQVDNPLTQVDEPEYYLNNAIDNFTSILSGIKECSSEESEIKNDLALAYLLRSEIHSSWSQERQNDIKNSTDIYNESLDIWNKDDYPVYYEDALNDQGVAFYYRSRINADESDLNFALNDFDEAIDMQKAGELELDLAETKRNQGKALRELANINNREKNLINAISSYNDAIKIWEEDPCPLDYAYTENLVGNAYLELSKMRDKEENLQYAIDAYTKALNIFNKEEYPEMNEIVEGNKNIAENPMW